MRNIVLPYNFTPRPYQKKILIALDKGIKRAVWVCHRRAGKDLTIWNWAITQAVKKRQIIYYLLPSYAQAKKIIWNGITIDGRKFLEFIPKELIVRQNESELLLELFNGSIVQLIGSDNIDSIVGTNPQICVFSEMALQNPRAWELMKPILRVNEGTAIFISCVAPKTLIITNDGLKRISKVSDSRLKYTDLNINIWGLGGFNNAEQFYYSSKVPTLKITLESGYMIECSYIHPIWNGEKWVKARNLNKGDLLPIEYGQNIWGKGLDFKEFKNNKHGLVKYKFDLNKINVDLFYLFGLINGDGYFSNTYVIVANIDKEIISFLHKWGFKSERENTHHRLGSMEMCSLLNYIGFKKGSKNKSIPDKLFNATKDQMRAFLQGLFDADGTSHSNPKYNGRVKYTSTCRQLINDIKVVLLNFGIVSGFTKEIKKPTKKVKVTSTIYNLEIDSYFAWQFYNEIGFRLTRKQNNSFFVKNKLKNESGNVIPIFAKKEDFKGYNLSKFRVLNQSRITRRKIAQMNKEKPNSQFEKILKNKFYYSPIKSIIKSESEVFDFVIPNNHSFFSNGFISHNTPRGKNDFYTLCEMAQKEENWFYERLTINDTNVLNERDIERERREGMSEELIQQEYYCSFDMGVEGSYYGNYIKKSFEENRIGKIDYDRNYLVNTAWDLGFNDSMVIIFYQKRGNDILIIDHYENRGFALNHYLDHLKTKEYAYGKHFAPFDANNHSNFGRTFKEVAAERGYNFTVLPRDKSIYDGIERARGLFPRVYFDEEKCSYLIKCLTNYHAQFDENKRVLAYNPLHDWSSHGADCFRYLALSLSFSVNNEDMSLEEYRKWKGQMGWM
jgi:intein/homing endonuclease